MTGSPKNEIQSVDLAYHSNGSSQSVKRKLHFEEDGHNEKELERADAQFTEEAPYNAKKRSLSEEEQEFDSLCESAIHNQLQPAKAGDLKKRL